MNDPTGHRVPDEDERQPDEPANDLEEALDMIEATLWTGCDGSECFYCTGNPWGDQEHKLNCKGALFLRKHGREVRFEAPDIKHGSSWQNKQNKLLVEVVTTMKSTVAHTTLVAFITSESKSQHWLTVEEFIDSHDPVSEP